MVCSEQKHAGPDWEARFNAKASGTGSSLGRVSSDVWVLLLPTSAPSSSLYRLSLLFLIFFPQIYTNTIPLHRKRCQLGRVGRRKVKFPLTSAEKIPGGRPSFKICQGGLVKCLDDVLSDRQPELQNRSRVLQQFRHETQKQHPKPSGIFSSVSCIELQ